MIFETRSRNLNNPNLSSYSYKSYEIGTIREQFFTNMLRVKHQLSYPVKGDFLIDDTYTFEIGGKNKSFKQIENVENSFVAADDIESGFANKIPLWLFGFLY